MNNNNNIVTIAVAVAAAAAGGGGVVVVVDFTRSFKEPSRCPLKQTLEKHLGNSTRMGLK